MRPAQRRAAGTIVMLVGLGSVAAMPAQAYSGQSSGQNPVKSQVIASGLNSPRHLTVGPDGSVYVAEAGYGGDLTCQTSPEFGKVCFGLTGSITKVDRNGQQRVINGLPSVGSATDAAGPADVELSGRRGIAIVLGLGGTPQYRAAFGPKAAMLGTVVTGHLHGSSRLKQVADITAYEAGLNPDGTDIDSNPASLATYRGGFAVSDAGANAVFTTAGRVLAVTPPVPTTKPGPVPVGTPADAVPTDAVRGSDGAWYVSELVGFPFEPGSSTIYRVVPGQAPQPWAWGLTNVTGLAVGDRGEMYAVQIANNGLRAGPVGSVVKVSAGANRTTVIATGLASPYGVAVHGSHLYVSAGSAAGKGAGQVLEVTLTRRH